MITLGTISLNTKNLCILRKVKILWFYYVQFALKFRLKQSCKGKVFVERTYMDSINYSISSAPLFIRIKIRQTYRKTCVRHVYNLC